MVLPTPELEALYQQAMQALGAPPCPWTPIAIAPFEFEEVFSQLVVEKQHALRASFEEYQRIYPGTS